LVGTNENSLGDVPDKIKIISPIKFLTACFTLIGGDLKSTAAQILRRRRETNFLPFPFLFYG